MCKMNEAKMNESIKKEAHDFARFLESLSEDEIRHGNIEQRKKTEEEFNRFKKSYENGKCYLCGKDLTSFSKKIPCLHWLLKPKGFKKKDIKSIYEKYGFYQIQSYLRWLANQESPFVNINDLKEEQSGSKLFEVTIRYKSLEWAFSCSPSDYEGHPTSQHAKHPHYHLQMKYNGNQLIKFNDFHIPFSKMDYINIETRNLLPNKVRHGFTFGEGMDVLFQEEVVEKILESTVTAENEQEGHFKIDTLIMAKPGEKIKGEDIYRLFEEAKEKGVTMASLAHKLDAESTVIVSPGPGAVEQSQRKGRKKTT